MAGFTPVCLCLTTFPSVGDKCLRRRSCAKAADSSVGGLGKCPLSSPTSVFTRRQSRPFRRRDRGTAPRNRRAPSVPFRLVALGVDLVAIAVAVTLAGHRPRPPGLPARRAAPTSPARVAMAAPLIAVAWVLVDRCLRRLRAPDLRRRDRRVPPACSTPRFFTCALTGHRLLPHAVPAVPRVLRARVRRGHASSCSPAVSGCVAPCSRHGATEPCSSGCSSSARPPTSTTSPQCSSVRAGSATRSSAL